MLEVFFPEGDGLGRDVLVSVKRSDMGEEGWRTLSVNQSCFMQSMSSLVTAPGYQLLSLEVVLEESTYGGCRGLGRMC